MLFKKKFTIPELLRNAMWKYELTLEINDVSDRHLKRYLLPFIGKSEGKMFFDNLLSLQKKLSLSIDLKLISTELLSYKYVYHSSGS